MSFSHLQIIFCFFFIPLGLVAQDLFVYELKFAYINKEHKTTTGFISLSDKYQFPEPPDSVTFPDSISENGLEYAILKDKYRANLLNHLSISETDSVFAYDYINDSTYTFPVHHLNTVAILNPYDTPGNSYPKYYYMIGFEVDYKHIKNKDRYLTDIFVSIGKTNPFSKAELHPIIWTPIDSSYFPSNFAIPQDLQHTSKLYTRSNTYEYIKGSLGYYSQDIMTINSFWARHLVVVNICTDEILLDNMYSNREGTSVAPLNGSNKDLDDVTFQWTGNLLNGEAPVLFGFTHQSYSCIRLSLIEQPAKYISLFCDNRH